MKRICSALVFVILVASLVAPSAGLSAGFRALDLHYPDNLTQFGSQAVGINDHGEVLFRTNTGYGGYGYLWTERSGPVVLSLDTCSGVGNINNRREVVGRVLGDSWNNYWYRATWWDSSKWQRPLVSIEEMSGSYATSINDNRLVTGGYFNGTTSVASVWTASSDAAGSRITVSDLGIDWASAEAVNNAGQVAWYSYGATVADGDVYVWDAAYGSKQLPLLAGTYSGMCFGINEHGDVAGYSGNHAVVWRADGSILDLGQSVTHGAAIARDINDRGEVVGEMDGRAVYWDPEGHLTYLDPLPGSGYASSAWRINELGQIAGQAQVNDTYTHAYYWAPVPVPEPSSICALLAGTSLLALLRRRRS